MTNLPCTLLLALLIITAAVIPVLVFHLSSSRGKAPTFKPRPYNDTSYLSTYYQVQYWDLDHFYGYLHDLVKSYTFFCELRTIGYTSKKGELPQNPIYVLKLSSGYPKPIVLIIGGIHANDWMSATSVLYLANQLLSNCSTEGRLITMYDWYLIPILNPDGYNYSHSVPAAKTWVKNIAQYSMDHVGVNINYNFEMYWQKGYNFNENTYPGVKAFSEAESRALRNFVLDIQKYIEIVYIFISPIKQSIRAPALIYPWSYTAAKMHPNWVLMEYLGLAGTVAAKNATGANYLVKQSGKLSGNQTGRIDDWLLGCTMVDKILTVLTDYVADLIHDPYDSITKMGSETFAIVRAVTNALFLHPLSYRRLYGSINPNHHILFAQLGKRRSRKEVLECRVKKPHFR